MARWSLSGRVAGAHALVAVVAASSAAVAALWFRRPVAGALGGLLIAAPVALYLARSLTRPWSRALAAVRDGIVSLRDRDLSISIGRTSDDELGELISAYNSLGDLLRRERFDLYQRELLLDTVIQTTPLVLVLTNAVGRIVYSNIAARQMLRQGRKLEGFELGVLIERAPVALREALARGNDTLFTLEVAGEPQVYHLSQREFVLNAQTHRLLLLKQLTRELAAQEVAVWKRVTRVIAHELNNSLAPISSLVHSGQMLAEAPDASQLRRVFTTIGERATHLASFIDGYARFAKLPQPRLAPTGWTTLLARIEGSAPFRIEGALPDRSVALDVSQMEQVLINLLKNATESGSPPEKVSLAVREHMSGFLIEVADRGSGFAPDVLRDALLPFFSTKPTGTGLGLTLCREIVEAHGGRLSVANRAGGGAVVTVWLPAP
jgi:two-component system, NtrC family, nitrogen regulation sensor histidine kinase NtrY